MKTSSFSTPTYHFIDIAPLAARFETLMAAVLVLIEAGQMREVLRYTKRVVRLVGVMTKFEAQNIMLRRKMDMLSHKPWRDLVIKQLGGLKRLKRWQASKKRIEARKGKPLTQPTPQPAWLLTPERIAESERLKAHARKCGRATAHPRVFRDKVRMDYEGEFRLAPLPRLPRGERVVKVYTQNTISDYDWNNMLFAKQTDFPPACVWPEEFFAAIKIEQEILEGRAEPLNVIPAQKASDAEARPKSKIGADDNDRCDGGNTAKARKTSLPTVSVHKVITPKLRHYLFTPLPTERPLAFQ